MTSTIHQDVFRLLGERFALDDLVAEADRLLLLAREDGEALASLGYGADDLLELEKLRAHIVRDPGPRGRARVEKRTRTRELDAIVDAKRLLRAGISAAARAVQKRVPPAGESAEESEGLADCILRQLDVLAGRVDFDAPRLRGRLAQLASILESPELAPGTEGQRSRALLVAKLRHARKTLPSLAALEKGLAATARDDAAAVSRMKGMVYANLKAMCVAGRTHFLTAGDAARAGAYSLTAFHAARRTKAADADAA